MLNDHKSDLPAGLVLAFQPFIEAIAEAVAKKLPQLTPAAPADPLLTPDQLAERLNVPVGWVYDWNRQRKLPVHYIGRYPRFILSEVLQALDKK